MKDSITQSYIDMVLLESLDKPYDLEDITHMNPDLVSKMKTNYDFEDDIKFYGCKDAPKHAFFTGTKHGAFEIHHQYFDKREMQGQKNFNDIVPSRFVATSHKLILSQLEKEPDKPIRIVASDAHAESYHKLAKVLARKHKLNVSPIYKHDDGDHVFSIGKNPSPLFGMPKIKQTNWKP